MRTKINISNKKDGYNKTVFIEDYMVLGRSGNSLEMMSNLQPEDLLILLMPILNELGERLNLFDDSYCAYDLMHN